MLCYILFCYLFRKWRARSFVCVRSTSSAQPPCRISWGGSRPISPRWGAKQGRPLTNSLTRLAVTTECVSCMYVEEWFIYLACMCILHITVNPKWKAACIYMYTYMYTNSTWRKLCVTVHSYVPFNKNRCTLTSLYTDTCCNHSVCIYWYTQCESRVWSDWYLTLGMHALGGVTVVVLSVCLSVCYNKICWILLWKQGVILWCFQGFYHLASRWKSFVQKFWRHLPISTAFLASWRAPNGQKGQRWLIFNVKSVHS